MDSIGTTTPQDPVTANAWHRAWPGVEADLVRYVSHLLDGDVHAAQDVVQETAVRLWQHPEVLADDRPVTGWARTVARHLVVDRVRRRRARPPEVPLEAAVDVGADGPDGTDRIAAADAAATMLDVLPPGQRIAVLEVYVRDRPVVEVAAELGIPVGTVKSRCHYAMRRLRADQDRDRTSRCA